MVSLRNRKFGAMRRWAAGIMIGGSALAATGCSLIPTTDDIRSATTSVKDTVTGKARKDKLNKTYAEARILERRKDFSGAERLYRELLVAEPKSRDCYHRLGVMAAVQGKYVEAQQNYQTALKCSQPTPDLLSDIGYCHFLQNELPLAEQALRSAVALDPQHAAATNNLAMVVGEQGKLDEAYELFRKANGEAEAECNFAYLCAQCGDLANAQAHFSRALSVNPDMRVAAEALLQVTQTMQRHQDEARARLAELAAQGNQPQQAGGPVGQAPGRVMQAGAQQPIAPQYSAPQNAAPQYAAQGSVNNQVGYSPAANNSSGIALAGGYSQAVAAQGGGVQPASHNVDPAMASRAAQALASPPQRLIEVHRGSPRTAAGSAQIAAAHAAASGAGNVPTHAAPPTSLASANPTGAPQAGGSTWGNFNGAATNSPSQPNFAPVAAPAPFSFPSGPSPQYLQPQTQSRTPAGDNSGAGSAPSASPNAAPANVAGGRQNGGLLAPAARPSVLSFPQP